MVRAGLWSALAFVLNLLWEIAQVRLYTIWMRQRVTARMTQEARKGLTASAELGCWIAGQSPDSHGRKFDENQ